MVRAKNRYFLCELVFDDPLKKALALGSHHLARVIKDVIWELHGDYGAAAVEWGFHVKYLNPYTSVMLVRVRHKRQRILATSLPFVESVAGCPVSIRTLHLAGTIRSCQKFLIKYNRRQLVGLLSQCRTKEERKQVRDSIAHCTLEREEKEFGDVAMEDTALS